ncbi:hypothetical protein HYX06_04350 [Candidatus Woesearchaeota archaeon]|nr:hypothetical protein [Candidatus Woesearchaeota archaeon]
MDLLEILAVDITMHRNLALKPMYGPLPGGQRVPEPVLEPGKHAHYGANGTEREILISRVHFEAYSYKRHPGWKYHSSDSTNLLDIDLIRDSWWPEQGKFPDFKKGEERYILLPNIQDPVKIIIMTQTSLNHGAHVLFVREEANALYSVPKSSLESVLVDAQNQDIVSNREVHATLRR